MKRIVLLSGGMDSTAALAWAVGKHDGADPQAMFVYYGQPAASHEVERAIRVSRDNGVPFQRMDMASAYVGGAAQGIMMPVSAGIELGLDKAFLPLRNPLLITAAAAYALAHWPGETIELVVGCNADDARGFPDCRLVFLHSLEQALQLSLGAEGRVFITAPFVRASKADIIAWVREHAPGWYTDLVSSWSCYRAKGPCGECNACVTRKNAFDADRATTTATPAA